MRYAYTLCLVAILVLTACGPREDGSRALASRPAVVQAVAVSSLWLPLEEEDATVAEQFLREDYAVLEARFRSAREGRTKTENCEWELPRLYDQFRIIRHRRFPRDREGYLERLRDWRQRVPSSITAIVLFLEARTDMAWETRQSDLVEPLVHSRRAARQGVSCPELYTQRLRLHTALGNDRTRRWQLYEEAVARYPDYQGIHYAMAEGCMPHLGGETGELTALAERATKLTAGVWGTGAYFLVASRVADMGGEQDFQNYGFAWEHIQSGYESMRDICGVSPHHAGRVAWMACALREREAAQQYLAEIRSEAAGDLWNPKTVALWLRWADGNIDPPQDHVLHTAAESGNLTAVRKAIDSGVAVDLFDPQARTPFVRAQDAEQWEVVRYLLAKGADPDEHSINQPPLLTLAVVKERRWLVDLLLTHAADVNGPSEHGRTPLHYAAREGRIEMLRLLLANPDIDVNATTHASEVRPARTATADEAEETLPDSPYVATDPYGYTPLLEALENDQPETALLLLEHGADANQARNNGGHPLTTAVDTRHAEVVVALLAGGADPMHQDYDGWSPLHMAAMSGRASYLASMLQLPGVDVDVPTLSGETPAHRAARAGHVEAIDVLIEHGADLGKRDRRGRTPLAAAVAQGRSVTTDYLRQIGAPE